MLVLTLSGTFIYAVTISTLARLTIYITTCAALPVLRRKPGMPAASLHVPGGAAIALQRFCLAVGCYRTAPGAKQEIQR